MSLLLFLSLLPQAHGQEPTHDTFVTNTNVPEARVVIASDPDATEALHPVPEKIQALVDMAITNLTRQTSVRAAWTNFVSPKDVVGIKVFTGPGPNSGTRRDVVEAVVKDLLAAGLPASNIVVWDRHAYDLRRAGYYELPTRYGIRVQSSVDAGYDPKIFYESSLIGTLSYDDLDFGKKGTGIGRKSYMSKLVTQELTKIITVTPMLHHNLLGLTGILYSVATGSMDNMDRFENSATHLTRAVPEICALPIKNDNDELAGRVVLNIVDALICQYEGQERSLLHYSTVLNELRFSKDPVALDVLSIQQINHERELADAPVTATNMELYVNASLLEMGVSDTNHIRVVRVP